MLINELTYLYISVIETASKAQISQLPCSQWTECYRWPPPTWAFTPHGSLSW